MDKCSKVHFVKQLNDLIRSTDEGQNITITYGSYEDETFIASDIDLIKANDPREYVQIKYDSMGDTNAVYQSVEMDNCFSILLDVMKGIEILRKNYR